MPVVKKNTTKKAASKTVIVTKSKTPAATTAFPKKLAKVNAMLGKTKWLDS